MKILVFGSATYWKIWQVCEVGRSSGGLTDGAVVRVLHVETTQRRLSRVGHREETLGEALQAMSMVDHGKMLSNLERHSIKLLLSSLHKHGDDKRLCVRIMVMIVPHLSK